jgi:hypothetical protein
MIAFMFFRFVVCDCSMLNVKPNQNPFMRRAVELEVSSGRYVPFCMQRGGSITQLGTVEHHASLSVLTVCTDVACIMYLTRRLFTAPEGTRDFPAVL